MTSDECGHDAYTSLPSATVAAGRQALVEEAHGGENRPASVETSTSARQYRTAQDLLATLRAPDAAGRLAQLRAFTEALALLPENRRTELLARFTARLDLYATSRD